MGGESGPKFRWAVQIRDCGCTGCTLWLYNARMNKPRENKPKTYRLSEQTTTRIAGLQKQYNIATATELVAFAIDQLWSADDGSTVTIKPQQDPQAVVSVATGNPWDEPEKPVTAPPVTSKPAYVPPAEVWVKQPTKKYDPMTGEHREWEKLDRRPWTERWLEGGDTEYWPA